MRRLVFPVLAAAFLLPSCDGVHSVTSGEGGVVVEPGKEDNFRSTAAQEYMVEGVTTVTLEPSLATASDDEKLRRVKQLIPLKQVVIGWFLNQYIVDKEHDQGNAAYGGFKGLTKNGAYEELGITAVDATTYQFTFRQEIGGQMDFLNVLPTTVAADGTRTFELAVGKVSNDEMARLETNAEWYRSSPWSEFDPAKVDASRIEKLPLKVWAEPRSIDAWLDYGKLFADGKVTIAVYWGWDYHSEYHLKHSQAVYEWLVGEQGFRSPVAKYDDYGRASGPLTKTVQAGGKAVTVEVTLHWGKPGTDTDPDTAAGGRVLEDDLRADLAKTEVIVFSGHSGPFYGFALANWRKTDEGDLDDSEIPGLAMPKDVYQVVHAEGCDTYGIGEAFRLNPGKPGMRNLDVITTTSFSNASTPNGTKDFLLAIFGTEQGRHVARTFDELLGDLESNSYWFSTMYGVHGIDDNPHRHPWADAGAMCRACKVNADCGEPGNRCVKMGSEMMCTFACTADDGCPAGFACRPVANGWTITSYACVPSNQTCKVAPPAPAGPAAVLNELLAAPEKVPGDGDANGDGTVSSSADEFVEIVNVSGTTLDLSGWSLSDSVMQRLAFPAGTKLAAGKALVVFGGGDPARFGSLGGALVLVASQKHLGLNNGGDTVILKDAAGKVVDKATYGSEGGKGRSLARAKDGDPAAAFVAHPDVPHSAGLKSDGTPF